MIRKKQGLYFAAIAMAFTTMAWAGYGNERAPCGQR
jgi:hypothetical protein